jgi:hypothetical protein
MAESPNHYLLIKRMMIYSLACITVVYSLIYAWQFVDYLNERDAWRSVRFAINRRGVHSERSLLLAASSSLVTLLAAIAARSSASLWTKINLLMCVPVVSYLSGVVGYARYEYFLVLHCFHAVFLFAILAWPRVVRGSPAPLDSGAFTRSFGTFLQNACALCVSTILILFFVTATDFDTLMHAVFDRTQIGGSLSGPVFKSKFNLWSIVIAQTFAVAGSLTVWSSSQGGRWAIFRGLLPLVASASFAPVLTSAFRGSDVYWPVSHSYDPGAFIGMTQGYVAWFVLSSILSVVCLMAIGTLSNPVLNLQDSALPSKLNLASAVSDDRG